jgi:hypothetical protein
MTAADARQLVQELALGEHVQKVVADAPTLTDAHVEALRLILSTTNAGPENRRKKSGGGRAA